MDGNDRRLARRSSACEHPAWEIVQPWEFIRKYRCRECCGIAMCECDRELGTRLRHQIGSVRPDGTRPDRVPVTLSFVAGVCPTCRGEREPAFPKADGYGSPSRFERYYWREIGKAAFLMHDGETFPTPEVWKAAKRVVENEHRARPKYDIDAHDRGALCVEWDERIITGSHEKDDHGNGRWRTGDRLVAVEDFVAEHLRSEGWQVLACERHLPASLFATFMTPVMVGGDGMPSYFGARDGSGRMVSLAFRYPPAAEIRDFAENVQIVGADLVQLWADSEPYREYLWAHDPAFFELVAWFVELAPEKVRDVLMYLATDYWKGQTGWPDLMARRENEFRLFEVKSPGDRLSEDQIRWFNDNATMLRLPASLVRVRRSEA